MRFDPGTFFVPSLAAHVGAAILLLVVTWNAATLHVPDEQMFRVNLVQVAQPRMTATPVTPAPKPAPQPAPKPAPKPEPKPEPKPAPKPAPEPVPKPPLKPAPQPVPQPAPAPTPRPVRKILQAPEDVKLKQQEWQAERERQQRERDQKRREELDRQRRLQQIATNPPPTLTHVPLPKSTVSDVPLQSHTAFDQSQQKLDQMQKQLQQDAQAARQRMESSVQALRNAGQAVSVAQRGIINEYFRNSLMTAIDRVWNREYAASDARGGQATVRFRLYRNGRTESIALSRSSGSTSLDESALEAVRRAAFPPFPANLQSEFLDVEAPFELELY
jgi:TonB family protein